MANIAVIAAKANRRFIFFPLSSQHAYPISKPSNASLQPRGAISIQAAFRFLAAFFLSYCACLLSISLLGTEISCFASFSKRAYSSEGGLDDLIFFISCGSFSWSSFGSVVSTSQQNYLNE